MSWEHQDVGRQCEQFLQAMVESGRTLLSLLCVGMQVGASNARSKEGISGKEHAIAEEITGTLEGVAWRMQRSQLDVWGLTCRVPVIFSRGAVDAKDGLQRGAKAQNV
jgi:hypothetical protein